MPDLFHVTRYWFEPCDVWAIHASDCGCHEDRHSVTEVLGCAGMAEDGELYLEGPSIDTWVLVPDEEVPDEVWAAIAAKRLSDAPAD